MDRVFQIFESMGYPVRGADWLRRRRGWVILALAIAAWIPVIAILAVVFF